MASRHIFERLAVSVAAMLLTSMIWGGVAEAETLKFISFQKDESGVGDWHAAVIKEFEATHPGVKIEFTKVEQPVYADTMTTLFASGSPPDIVHLAAFDFPKIADNGWLEPLDVNIKASGLDLNGWAGQEKCKWKGQTYCVMALYFGFFLAYNDALLQEAGAKVPTNYAEWLDAVRKTTKRAGGVTTQLAWSRTGAGTGWYLTEMLKHVRHRSPGSTRRRASTLNTRDRSADLWKTINRERSRRSIKPAHAALFTMQDRNEGRWTVAHPHHPAGETEIRQHIKLAVAPFHPPVGGSSIAGHRARHSGSHTARWDYLKIAPWTSSRRSMAPRSIVAVHAPIRASGGEPSRRRHGAGASKACGPHPPGWPPTHLQDHRE